MSDKLTKEQRYEAKQRALGNVPYKRRVPKDFVSLMDEYLAKLKHMKIDK